MLKTGTSAWWLFGIFPQGEDVERQNSLKRGLPVLVLFPVLSTCAFVSQEKLDSDAFEASFSLLVHVVTNVVVVLLLIMLALIRKSMAKNLPACFSNPVVIECTRCLMVVGVFMHFALFEAGGYQKRTNNCAEVQPIGFLLWSAFYISAANCVLPVRTFMLGAVNCGLMGVSVISTITHKIPPPLC